MPPFSTVRAAVVMSVIALALLGMTGRVAYLETYKRQQTIRSADRQQHQNQQIIARRGSIFDCYGNAMALTVQTLNLYVDPEFLIEEYHHDPTGLPPAEAAKLRTPAQMTQDLRTLSILLDQPGDYVLKKIQEKPEARYLKLAECLPERLCQEILKLKVPGVGLEPMGVRYYPMGSLASHVLGTVCKDGSGLEGLELKFQKELAGQNGWKRIEKDAGRRPIGVDAEDYIPPAHGQHLVLTLDANVQMMAEQELAEGCTRTKAKRGEVVVMNPRTGDVLALANWPTFNPQTSEDSPPELRRNRALTDPYEPGSTCKPFVMGPALDQKITRPNEVWPINSIHYNLSYGKGRTVTDVHFYGPLATWDVLVKSSNIGMSMLAERMGNPALYKALTSFGFGRRTGIELPGEDPGLVKPLNKWARADTESVAQGYAMMVTPLQIARAFCAYGNGGKLVSPRLVKGVLDADGNIISRQRACDFQTLPQVVDEETTRTMRRIMCDVVVRGTAASAPRSGQWNIFGKTGTAHIATRSGYAHDRINASFICGAPAEDPQLIVAMIIHDPDRSVPGARYGGGVSAPPAIRLVERALAYMQVPESCPLDPPPQNVIAVLHNYNAKKYAATASAHD